MMRLVFLFCAEERGAAPPRRPALRRSTTPSRRCARSCARRPTSTARRCSSAATTPGRACSPPSARSTAASSTTRCACRPTAAACSTPTASRSSKAARRERRWRDDAGRAAAGQQPHRAAPARGAAAARRCRCRAAAREARRLSFRALDIEQIGHVYEGLLDHTALRATEPVLGLAGARGQGAGDPARRAGGGRGNAARTTLVALPRRGDRPVGTGRPASALSLQSPSDDLLAAGRLLARLRRRRGPARRACARSPASCGATVGQPWWSSRRAASTSPRAATAAPPAPTTRPAASPSRSCSTRWSRSSTSAPPRASPGSSGG